ncbi:hypothetical protein VDF90_04240 [Xanthomonas campestris pv. raphani]|uniref:hypothetical protein n=1 Tax=Xanthomonas campestris TaxID=339 RepID=UPI002B237971|nr:hypothetical protein [Xanthomonas campestris]MEA9786471.1 hypothetical protein [Xanthomonas campestris pv. raphani]
MSKSSEKGRKGELAVTGILSNIGVYEPSIEVVRANTTATPESGVDIALKCPHNLSQKFDEIVSTGSSKIALANSQIDVRVQVKNYSGPINKAVAQSFVDDISKNQNFSEHWGVGGTRLTKGAQEVLEKANEVAPVKWYAAPDIEKIQAQYPAVPFTEINGIKKEE